MSRKSKQKGYRTEYNLVKYFIKKGLSAKRQPLSGALVDFPHDIQMTNPDEIMEVKGRQKGKGWKRVKKWDGREDEG